MYGVNLIWVQLDTISIIKATKEVDSWDLHMCFLSVEH